MIGGVPESHPWSRVDDPTPIPSPLTVEALAGLDDTDFRHVIRDHLIPRDDSAAARGRWQSLWTALGSPQLRNRTFDVLEEFLDQVEAHLATEPGDRRARQFEHRCGTVWSRLTKPASDKARYSDLAAAVRRHRATILDGRADPRPADVELWRQIRRRR